jgi:hypothetical protein
MDSESSGIHLTRHSSAGKSQSLCPNYFFTRAHAEAAQYAVVFLVGLEACLFNSPAPGVLADGFHIRASRQQQFENYLPALDDPQ